MENHESFLVCPGKQPIKIGANYPVSIHIYFDNFVHRTNKRHQQQTDKSSDEVLIQIVDKGFHNDSDNRSHQHRINARHELIEASRGQNIRENKNGDNKSSQTRTQFDLIESNRNIKNINRTDGEVKHFIRIYHWLGFDKQTTKKKHQTVSEAKSK